MSFFLCLGKAVLRDCSISCVAITKTCLFKYIENFTSKNRKFSEIYDILHLFAQNIDSEYTLEPPRRDEYPQSIF